MTPRADGRHSEHSPKLVIELLLCISFRSRIVLVRQNDSKLRILDLDLDHTLSTDDFFRPTFEDHSKILPRIYDLWRFCIARAGWSPVTCRPWGLSYWQQTYSQVLQWTSLVTQMQQPNTYINIPIMSNLDPRGPYPLHSLAANHWIRAVQRTDRNSYQL